MLVSDEGCIAEQTILRYQNNSVAELMNSDWFGIMLLSPKGKIFIDSCYDVSGVGTEQILSFVSGHVTDGFLAEGEPGTFYEENCYLYVYPIRKTDNHYYVFFVFYKRSAPFPERDLQWYKIYAQTALQRLLLENELAQDKNYLANILRTVKQPVAVFDARYQVISSNSSAKRIYQDSLAENHLIRNLPHFRKAVDDVIFHGCDRNIDLVLKTGATGDVCLTPLKNNKDVVVAVVAVGGGEVLNE